MSQAAWKSDPWRAVCPEGHTSWRYHNELTEKPYECRPCGEHFSQLHDKKELEN